jgi:hypothetical protein
LFVVFEFFTIFVLSSMQGRCHASWTISSVARQHHPTVAFKDGARLIFTSYT